MNELFALVPKVWNDLGGMMARRWWAGLIIASVVGLAVAGLHYPPGGTAPPVLSMIVLAGIWFVLFPEAMRVDDPAYVLNVQRFAPLLLLMLFLALIAILVFAPVMFLDAYVLRGAGPVVTAGLFFLVLLAFQTKFSFVLFAADSTDSPIAFSWRATAGRALVATAVLTIVAMVVTSLVDLLFDQSVRVLGPVAPLANALDVAARFVLFAFLSAWTIRWMRAAEAMQATPVPE